MGLFNRLSIHLICENCSQKYDGKLQFKVGDVGLYHYQIGDIIKIELRGKELKGKEISAYGILEDVICPFCGHSNENQEYNIRIKDLIIVEYSKMLDYSPYLNHNEGSFYIIK